MKRVLASILLIILLAMPGKAPAYAGPVATGSISGRVTDVVTGAPLANVEVGVVNTSVPVVKTDADGRYRLTGVTSGARYVSFTDPTGRYASEYYDDAPI